MAEYKLISADSHVNEVSATWERVRRNYGARAPEIVWKRAKRNAVPTYPFLIGKQVSKGRTESAMEFLGMAGLV
jgi:hypothetical protein